MKTHRAIEETSVDFVSARDRRLELGRKRDETDAEIVRLERALHPPTSEKPDARATVEAMRRLPGLKLDRLTVAVEIESADQEIKAARDRACGAAAPEYAKRLQAVNRRQEGVIESLANLEAEKISILAEAEAALGVRVQTLYGLMLPEARRADTEPSLLDLRRQAWARFAG